MNFQVGDMIILSVNHPDGNRSLNKGDSGIIKYINDDIAVEFDFPFSGGHSCDASGRDGYCWWVDESDITFSSPCPSPYEDVLI